MLAHQAELVFLSGHDAFPRVSVHGWVSHGQALPKGTICCQAIVHSSGSSPCANVRGVTNVLLREARHDGTLTGQLGAAGFANRISSFCISVS